MSCCDVIFISDLSLLNGSLRWKDRTRSQFWKEPEVFFALFMQFHIDIPEEILENPVSTKQKLQTNSLIGQRQNFLSNNHNFVMEQVAFQSFLIEGCFFDILCHRKDGSSLTKCEFTMMQIHTTLVNLQIGGFAFWHIKLFNCLYDGTMFLMHDTYLNR